MFLLSTSIVTSNIIAKIRGGVTSSNDITVDDLCSHLKKTPLYEKFVDANNNESLCEAIWHSYQYFRESFMEYCILWDRYFGSESLELISKIKDCDFYRCLNENFSLYNTPPEILPNGSKVFRYKVLDKVFTIEKQVYNNAVEVFMANLVSLISHINKIAKHIA